MTIGEVACRTGVPSSAIRYYERTGVLPRPARMGGRRQYHQGTLQLLAALKYAKACGFTLAETRQLLTGIGDKSPVSARWRALARKRIAELDALASRIAVMRDLVERVAGCECQDGYQCGQSILSCGNNLQLR